MATRRTLEPIPAPSRAAELEALFALLRQIPEDLFFQVASKASLTTEQARELCEAFRRLKT